MILDNILNWFGSKNFSSHAVFVAACSLAALITTDVQVQTFIVTTLQAHPAVASDIILLAGAIAKYSHSTSKELR